MFNTTFTATRRIALTGALICLGAAAQAQTSSTVVIQGSNGHGVEASNSGSYNPDTGTYSREGTVTTNNGQTISHSSTGSCVKTANGMDCSGTSTASGANRSATRNKNNSCVRTTNGLDCSGTSTTTGSGGRSATTTRQRWIAVNP